MPRKKKQHLGREQLLHSCLAAFVRAGTLDLSLDSLAKAAGSSKRMLIHYFGGREAIEEMAMALLEERLRARFRASAFPAGASLRAVVAALWEQTTSAESRGVVRLAMDLTRRSWSGSERARRFFEEQQRLWGDLLREFLPDEAAVEALLQMFGQRALDRLVSAENELQRKHHSR
jgi:AcrR family transcriptional regulator